MEPVTPLLPRGPRAQETVWGRALRNATWGDHDPNGRLATTPGITRLELSNRKRGEDRLDNLSSWAGQPQPRSSRMRLR
jgi:hypothetical protein